ncbi:MAG: Rrf2 family transcriptional regulator [Spirochaetia bacterium]|nr:Rrf2 family transcriptional regulator [Spirochaetia bacterium]
MKVTSKGRYGIIAMMELYQSSRLVKNREIAEKHNISVKYLEQIINILKKNQLVKSARGADGGYTLALPGNKITIYQILEALEGDLSVMDKSDKNWNQNADCFWQEIDNQIKEYLKISLEDFVKKCKQNSEELMYFI